MKIVVHVKPKSSQARVELVGEDEYRVWVTSPPEKGKANKEMLDLLADYFEVSKSSVRLVMGKTAREKLVEIL